GLLPALREECPSAIDITRRACPCRSPGCGGRGVAASSIAGRYGRLEPSEELLEAESGRFAGERRQRTAHYGPAMTNVETERVEQAVLRRRKALERRLRFDCYGAPAAEVHEKIHFDAVFGANEIDLGTSSARV